MKDLFYMLLSIIMLAIAAALIIIPIVIALMRSPLYLLMLILTFPFAAIFFYCGIEM